MNLSFNELSTNFLTLIILLTNSTSNSINFIHADKIYPEVLVSTDKGINHIFLDLEGNIKEIKKHVSSAKYKHSISSNYVWPITRENDSIFWVEMSSSKCSGFNNYR